MLTENILQYKEQPYAIREPVISKTKRFDYNLEALRGIAALLVVISHVIEHANYLDPSYFPSSLSNFSTPAHLSVLIFFVLSGYVIGISNKQRLAGKNILAYLKKRLVRLYPVYIVCLLFTLAVAVTKNSFGTIVSNFTFTQNIFSDVIWEDNPIWSLNYEVLYYLMFIPISFFDIDPIVLSLSSAVLGMGNRFLYPQLHTAIITSYLYGFAFWTAGLMIAKYYKKNSKEINFTLLFSNVFLILCISHFNALSTGLSKLNNVLFRGAIELPHTVNWYERAIAFADLSYLPYCLMFVLVFSGKEFKYKKSVFGCLQILPFAMLVYKLKKTGITHASEVLVASIYYIISLILYLYKSGKTNFIAQSILKGAAWLGSISYGIYIFHFPMLILFARIHSFSGSALLFTVRFILFFALTLFCSYLLERKFQPWIKQKIA